MEDKIEAFREYLISDEKSENTIGTYIDSLNKYLFPNRYGEQMSKDGVSQTLRKCTKYGIRKEVLHPHSFRHLYAIQFLKRNKNIALLADLMGHESVDTTSIYLRLSAEEQKKQFNDAMNW